VNLTPATIDTGAAILCARDGGRHGAAAHVLAHAYASGNHAGRRAMLARAVRIGAAHGAAARRAGAHHAPPYPVPVRAWQGRAW